MNPDTYSAGPDLAPHLERPCAGCLDPHRCRYVEQRATLRDLGGEERPAARYRCANPTTPTTPAPVGEESPR